VAIFVGGKRLTEHDVPSLTMGKQFGSVSTRKAPTRVLQTHDSVNKATDELIVTESVTPTAGGDAASAMASVANVDVEIQQCESLPLCDIRLISTEIQRLESELATSQHNAINLQKQHDTMKASRIRYENIKKNDKRVS
jgi:hypothetical protein